MISPITDRVDHSRARMNEGAENVRAELELHTNRFQTLEQISAIMLIHTLTGGGAKCRLGFCYFEPRPFKTTPFFNDSLDAKETHVGAMF